MNFLVVFSCAMATAAAVWSPAPSHYGYHVPVIGPNGVPADTPEVAAAKAAHLAALNGASAVAGPYNGDDGRWNHDDGSELRYHGPHAYQTTYGVAKVNPDGVPLDTPEVAAAKANHFGAFSEALSRAGPYHGAHYRRRRGIYHHPEAHDFNFYGVGHDGRPLDTPVVAHAKAAAIAAYNDAAARNGVGHAAVGHLYAAPWAHAVPHIAHGVPADTPEVAAAKAAHFAAHAAASGHGHYY